MQKHFVLILAALAFSACQKKIYTIKSDFSSSVIPSSPDYRDIDNWASLPTKMDAADSVPKNSKLKEMQASAKADVFFIYPTIFTEEPNNQYLWNADVKDEKLNQKIQMSTILKFWYRQCSHGIDVAD